MFSVHITNASISAKGANNRHLCKYVQSRFSSNESNKSCKTKYSHDLSVGLEDVLKRGTQTSQLCCSQVEPKQKVQRYYEVSQTQPIER